MTREVVIVLDWEKETSNTVRYQERTELGANPYLKYIYLQKTLVAKLGKPQTIQLIVSPVED